MYMYFKVVLLNLAELVLVLKVITGTTAVDMPSENPGTTIGTCAFDSQY